MDKLFNTMALVTIIISIVVMVVFCGTVLAEQATSEDVIIRAIATLHPEMEYKRTTHLAKLINEHARFTKAPHPNFIVSIIERESRFNRQIEIGAQYGRDGDIGLMQVMPRGAAIQHMRRSRNDCDQRDANCNIMTGAMWLQEVREQCGSNDPWVWMAAYGTDHCPTSKAARTFKSAKNARRIFCKITEDCATHWPQ